MAHPILRTAAALLLAAFVGLSAIAAAAASQLVVIEASGVEIRPGQVIEGGQTLSLPEGAKLTLIDEDGTPVRLVGPFEGPSGESSGSGEGGRLIAALAGLFAGGEGSNTMVGATREAAAEESLRLAIPDAWAIPVGRPGDYCLRPDGPNDLWRPDASEDAILTLSKLGGGWQGQQVWRRGSSRLPMPPRFPGQPEAGFLLIHGEEAAEVTLHMLPGAVRKTALRAALMAEAGCDLQAMALLDTLK